MSPLLWQPIKSGYLQTVGFTDGFSRLRWITSLPTLVLDVHRLYVIVSAMNWSLMLDTYVQILYGQSLGGAIAIDLAARRGESVRLLPTIHFSLAARNTNKAHSSPL